ncbi:hypothetical protein FS749_015031 [Ceratobasidium sp. UAMH 11750]|nr:hypothetical protein FS749_015031 [Ceratobasidium sp. UAMH 11750]
MAIFVLNPALSRLQDLSPEELEDRVVHTRFAFRVLDNQSHVTYDHEQGFRSRILPSTGMNGQTLCLYRSAAHHVDCSFHVQSPWISASRRWDWALWEMARRRRTAANLNIRVAIIDVYALLNESKSPVGSNIRIYHALQLLDPLLLDKLGWNSTWGGRRPAQLQNFSNVADEILFFQSVPASAIISVVALDDITRDAPGYSAGWLEQPSFRDAHAALCESHLNSPSRDIALEYVNFALALLQPAYSDLRAATWSLFLDVVGNILPLSGMEYHASDLAMPQSYGNTALQSPDLIESLVEAFSALPPETLPRIAERGCLKRADASSGAFRTRMKILTDKTTQELAALKVDVLKQSMILDIIRLLAKEADSCEILRPHIRAMTIQLLDQCRVAISPKIARQIDSARQTIRDFKQRSSPDQTKLELRITKAVDINVAWLEDALELLRYPGGVAEV